MVMKIQPHKSVATSRVNPGILRNGGGTEMWVWLCAGSGIYLGSGGTAEMRKIERNIVRLRY